jgi:hypothetical protein
MTVRMELSQRLYKHTGWTTHRWWAPWPFDDPESKTMAIVNMTDQRTSKYGKFPSYSADDLLEELGAPLILMHHSEGWRASQNGYNGNADTMQDALAELALAITWGGTNG